MLKLIKDIIKICLTGINKFLPKRNQILLYSDLGFRDNVKSIYDYIIANNINKNFKVICSTDEYKLFKYNNSVNVRFVGKKSGLLFFLFTKYVFYCFGNYGIKPSKQQIVIHLWHGMPLKKFGFMKKTKIFTRYANFTYVISTSNFFSNILMQGFGCNIEQILICGQPRTDNLFTNLNINSLFKTNKYDKIIIWMPTFRKSSRLHLTETDSCKVLPIFEEDEDFCQLNELLLTRQSYLYIKLHPMQDNTFMLPDSFSNISLIDDKYITDLGIDLYTFLSGTDALITDYSSVFIDYLLLDRPIGFTIDDINEFRNIRGFAIDNPTKYMPGQIIMSKSELFSFFEDVIDNKDYYQTKRKFYLDLFHVYKDNKNTERILRFCNII